MSQVQELSDKLRNTKDTFLHDGLFVSDSQFNEIPCRGLFLRFEPNSTPFPNENNTILVASLPEGSFFTSHHLQSFADPWLHQALKILAQKHHPLPDRYIFLISMMQALFYQRVSSSSSSSTSSISTPSSSSPTLFQLYFNTLPFSETLCSPLFYSASEFELLTATAIPTMLDAKWKVLSQEFQLMVGAWKQSAEVLQLMDSFTFMESNMDLEDYVWLDTLFWSRVIELPKTNTLVMVPFMDMANHSSTLSNLSWEYSNDSSTLHWYCSNPSSSAIISILGCPLLLNYATTTSNESLLFVHGFCDKKYQFKGPVSIYLGDLFNEDMAWVLDWCQLSPMSQFPPPPPPPSKSLTSSQSSTDTSPSAFLYLQRMSMNSRVCLLLASLWEYLNLHFSETGLMCFNHAFLNVASLDDFILMSLSKNQEWQTVVLERISLLANTILKDFELIPMSSSSSSSSSFLVNEETGLCQIRFGKRDLHVRPIVVQALSIYLEELKHTLTFLAHLNSW